MAEIDPAKQAYESIAGIYDEFTGANDYEMWFGELLPRLEALGLRQGALLDVACGTGRAIDPMLRRGWTITACDISPAMIKKAREKFPQDVAFDVCDMRELPVYGTFEMVWALNDPVNYLLGDDDLVPALGAMSANLAEDGLLVFDCNTRRLFRDLFSPSTDDEDDGAKWDWKRLGGDGNVFAAEISGPGVEPHVHKERHRSVEEVHAAMAAVGLASLATMGQSESEESGLTLVDDWDEDRDHKIIHVAQRA